jgi:hypothetical protein
MWLGALADLHGRCGDEHAARRFGEQALQATPSPSIEAALARRLRRNVAMPRRPTEGAVKRE